VDQENVDDCVAHLDDIELSVISLINSVTDTFAFGFMLGMQRWLFQEGSSPKRVTSLPSIASNLNHTLTVDGDPMAAPSNPTTTFVSSAPASTRSLSLKGTLTTCPYSRSSSM